MNLKVIAVSVGVLCAVGIAAFQANRYFGHKQTRQDTALQSIVVDTKFDQYDIDKLRSSGDVLGRALHQQTYRALRGLEAGYQPTEAQADLIAAAYARFLILRRTATREEYLAQVVHTPSSGLTDENIESAETAWKYDSAWARHADIPVESVRVLPVFIRGVSAGNFNSGGIRVMRPLMGSGKMLSADTVGGYSVYKVLIDMTVPSIDASQDLEITAGTMMVNDGPGGAWSPVAVEFIGVPQGKFCYVPSP